MDPQETTVNSYGIMNQLIDLQRKKMSIYISYTALHVMGVKGDWDFWISDLVKNPDGTDI